MCQTVPTNPVVPHQQKTYVLDMDGVVNLGDTAIPGAADAINALVASGRRIYYLTNNSSRSRVHYLRKLAGFGIQAQLDTIYTSAYVAARYLAAGGGMGKTVFVVGEQGLAEELVQAGLNAVTEQNAVDYTQVDYIVAGIDRSFTYDKLRFAHAAIVYGHAQLIATNRDATYPTETVEVPGGGAIVASIATATGREPVTIGKPSPFALEMILRETGASRESATMVGDRLDTDIAAGNAAGISSILVLTGVTTRLEAESITDPLWRPTKIIGTLAELLEG